MRAPQRKGWDGRASMIYYRGPTCQPHRGQPMKITHVETHAVRIPLVPAKYMITALGKHTESPYLLVRLGTDAGIDGAGEATATPNWSGETVWGTKAIIDRVFAPAVLGCDPRNIEEIDRRMDRVSRHNWFAKSAIEMARWDIAGKAG